MFRVGRRGMHIVSWWESQRKQDHYEDPDEGSRIILKMDLRGIE
jgi:hypothetical protein